MTIFFILPALAFLSVVLIMPVFCKLAIENDFVDKPGGRKKHDTPTPLVGGLVIFLTFFLMILPLEILDTGIFKETEYASLWGALLLVLLVGFIDDKYHISAYVKLLAQVIATVMVVLLGDAQVQFLGNFFGFGEIGLGPFGIIFSLAAVLLLINAINLSDGLDGLAGGQSFIILGMLLIGALAYNQDANALLISLAMACVAGFLIYNMRSPFRKKASVFMGDAGSLALGVLLAWLAVEMGKKQSGEQILTPISIAWILWVPIMDACCQFIRRMREGRHPFSPDRGHLHYHFVDNGFTVSHTVLILMALSALGGFLAFSPYLFGLPEYVLTYLWAGVFIVYTLVSLKQDRLSRSISSLKPS